MHSIKKPKATLFAWSLALFNVLLLSLVLSFHRSSSSPKAQLWSFVGPDFPPHFPLDVRAVEMTFEETQRYESSNTSSADAQWSSLVPRKTHQGYVRLGPDRRVFAVAMFHELHCMATFHRALAWHDHPDANIGHFQHCLNYLRQLFMCAADTTLEPYDFMRRDYSVEPVGHTRVCRDWSTMYRETDENWTAWLDYAVANRTKLGLVRNETSQALSPPI